MNVTARATDAGSPAAFDTVSFQVTVQNVAPTLVLSGAANVDQGTPFTLNLAASDPGVDAAGRILGGHGEPGRQQTQPVNRMFEPGLLGGQRAA